MIGLPDSRRLEVFFQSPLSAHFHVRDAVDGRGDRAVGLLNEFDRDLCIERTGRMPTGPEMGCALSHARVLTAFADKPGSDDDLIVVAEDDALLSDDLAPVLDEIARRSTPVDYVILADPFGEAGWTPRFGHSRNSLSLPWTAARFRAPSGITYRWGRGFGDYYGTGLYVASRRAARNMKALIDQSGKVHWVADDYSYWAQQAGIDLQFLRPNLAGWHGVSTIQPESAHTLDQKGGNLSPARLVEQNGRSLARQFKRSARATMRDLRRYVGSRSSRWRKA